MGRGRGRRVAGCRVSGLPPPMTSSVPQAPSRRQMTVSPPVGRKTTGSSRAPQWRGKPSLTPPAGRVQNNGSSEAPKPRGKKSLTPPAGRNAEKGSGEAPQQKGKKPLTPKRRNSAVVAEQPTSGSSEAPKPKGEKPPTLRQGNSAVVAEQPRGKPSLKPRNSAAEAEKPLGPIGAGGRGSRGGEHSQWTAPTNDVLRSTGAGERKPLSRTPPPPKVSTAAQPRMLAGAGVGSREAETPSPLNTSTHTEGARKLYVPPHRARLQSA